MHKKWIPILLMLTLILLSSISGCNVSDRSLSVNGRSQIADQAYTKNAENQEQILELLMDTMNHNQDACEFYVPSEALINADSWLAALPGIEQIHCEYKKVQNSNGFNVLVTLQYWDNYPIVYAYHNSDTSFLNDRQKELYAKYCEVLSGYTSPTNTAIQNEISIHDYLINNITYVEQDNSGFNAYNAMIHQKAVCSGYTECFKTFMDLLGIENSTVSGTAGDEQHIWNEVKLDGEWYQVDVTWDDPINNPLPCNDHSYFNITDADMAIDHSWDEAQSGYHRAEGTKYSYIGFMGMLSIDSQAALTTLLQNAVNNQASYLEYSSSAELDIKAALATTNVNLTYSYKVVKRTAYSLCYISFNYDS